MAGSKPQRIPFDSFVLASVANEVRQYVGGKVQGIRQPNETSIFIGLYAGGAEATLMLSCHPVFARAHFVTKRPANSPTPPTFCATLRARIDGAKLVAVRQIALDRIIELDFDSPKGPHTLIAELMGKHSNLMLVDEANKVVTAAKWVARSMSSRPIQPGAPYVVPPVLDNPNIKMDEAAIISPADWIAAAEATGHTPPFLAKLLAAGEIPTAWAPVTNPGVGAYAISVAALGIEAFPRATMSIALENHFDIAVIQHELASVRQSILGPLQRILLAREVAIHDLSQAVQAGLHAGKQQRLGELILAYGASAPAGSTNLQAWDYDGTEVAIPILGDLDFKQNANRYFEKARKAKDRLGMVQDQIARLTKDREAILAAIACAEQETRLDRLREQFEEAKKRHWLNTQALPTANKDERPYEGNRIRELVGPGGYPVFYGENAESNDYLTLRVAKPNDMWLHVRGATSAHVIIATHGHPEKIQKEHLEFAAKIAVNNSPSKHSGFVAVDYTLRKYVWKPRGAPKGTALYKNEKTLHVDGER